MRWPYAWRVRIAREHLLRAGARQLVVDIHGFAGIRHSQLIELMPSHGVSRHRCVNAPTRTAMTFNNNVGYFPKALQTACRALCPRNYPDLSPWLGTAAYRHKVLIDRRVTLAPLGIFAVAFEYL